MNPPLFLCENESSLWDTKERSRHGVPLSLNNEISYGPDSCSFGSLNWLCGFALGSNVKSKRELHQDADFAGPTQ
jgi:hypothetical protein